MTHRTLNHHDIVRINTWRYTNDICYVGSIEGYCKDENLDITERLEKASRLGHEIAWANKRDHCLSSSVGFYDRLKEEEDRAIPLENGEIVEIEGRKYTVKNMGVRYSDAIHFVPIKEQNND